MPITEYHSFENVVCIDLKANKVMKNGNLNLRLTFYTEEECAILTPDYKNLLENNMLCEFEYIFELPNHVQNQFLNSCQEYAFKIFETSQIVKTEMNAIVLKLERTTKISESSRKYFYMGVKNKTVTDDLGIFGGFAPKTYVVANKNKNQLVIKKVKNEKEEKDLILGQEYQGCEFYHLEKYFNESERKPTVMLPVNISHLL